MAQTCTFTLQLGMNYGGIVKLNLHNSIVVWLQSHPTEIGFGWKCVVAQDQVF
jgi:hypothetical protein